jgi:hypothetical protein
LGRSSFGKLERDRAKKAKQAAKRDKRLTTDDDALDDEDATPAQPDDVSTDELLRMIEDLHKRFDAGDVSYDDFEETKANLLGRLQVD